MSLAKESVPLSLTSMTQTQKTWQKVATVNNAIQQIETMIKKHLPCPHFHTY